MSTSALTQDEFVLEIASTLGVQKATKSVDGVTTYEDRIKQWLYWAHLSISRIFAFPELDADKVTPSTVASTNRYTFATLGLIRPRQILSFYVVDPTLGAKAQKLTQQLFRRFDQDHADILNDTEAMPQEYTIYGKAVELWYIPEKVYTMNIRYNQYPLDFATGASTSPYLFKDDVIIAGTLVNAYQALMETDDSKRWADIFASRLTSAIALESEPQDWEPEGRGFGMVSNSSNADYQANPLSFFNQGGR